MNRLKRMALLCCAALICLTGLVGCAENEAEAGQPLAVSVGNSPVSLDPIYAEESGDQSILVQLYENLMRVTTDQEGKQTVTNGMAKRVSQKHQQDGTVAYTFELGRAKWSDGKPVQAEDFVYAWRRLADPVSQSPYASLLSVVSGYQEARASGDMTLLQVKAEGDSTLVVTLDGRYEWFLTEVCTSPATMPLREDVIRQLKEQNQLKDGSTPWWSDPTKLVTNGAYVVSDWEPERALTVQRHADRSSRHVGPSEISFLFADNPEAAWELYESKAADVVWPLPKEELVKLDNDPNWTPVPALSTHAILFNDSQEQLADPMVRQAMAFVLDRQALAQVKGQAVLPAEGLVPPGVPENEQGDFRTVAGPLYENEADHYDERCDEARAMLDEAGHGAGESLGQLEYLYVDEGSNRAVAEALCRMWKEQLNLTVIPRGVTENALWEALRSGEFQLAGADLTAPGNDAECFLMQWTSDSNDNLVHYRNSAYDTLMNIIATANSEMARMGCLHDAEALLLADNVVVPLYTEGTGWKLREGYTGLCRDPRGWFSFTEVFHRNG